MILSSLKDATTNLENKVDERTKELTSLNHELEAFSYSVSHDLRAPLRGIDGFSQFLMDEYADKLDGEALKYLNYIRSGVQRMGKLIDDLINLSRLTRMEMKIEEVDIANISEEVINEVTKDLRKNFNLKI
jgi:light-regulated signal transduction histidine kinase (bacteriophytochrome)